MSLASGSRRSATTTATSRRRTALSSVSPACGSSSTSRPSAPADDSSSTAWLDNLNRDPNSPEVRALTSVEGHPDPVGARVVIVGDQIETDMRAVSPVRMTNGGDLAITVMAERDWYRWARDYPAQPHPSLRWEHAANVLVE